MARFTVIRWQGVTAIKKDGQVIKQFTSSSDAMAYLKSLGATPLYSNVWAVRV